MSNLPPEDEYEKLVRTVRETLIGQWIHENLDIGDVATEARLAYSTADNFLHYRTQRPQIQTVVKIARVLGLKIIVVAHDAKAQPAEVRVTAAMRRKVRHLARIAR